VDDLEAQRRFYRDVLGFAELASGEGWIQFDMGWPNMFELLGRGREPQYDARRYQVGYEVMDIRAARRDLVQRGAEAISEIEGDEGSGGYWCYFRDPEGNVFEITQRLGRGWPKGPD
jgi:catechol 2,3-dioxygenase-like lactoylglutathione lyase family enzyme